ALVADLEGLVALQRGIDEIAEAAAGLEHRTVARVLGEQGPARLAAGFDADPRTGRIPVGEDVHRGVGDRVGGGRKQPFPPLMRALAVRPLLLAAGVLLAAGCDPRKKLVGTWDLATLDGVAPAVATPVRVLFPAAKYGSDTTAARGMWHEVTFDSLVLTIDP